MTKKEIKQMLEKFRQLAQSQKQLNQSLAGNVEVTLKHCNKYYNPNDLIKKERKVIIEACESCYKLYIQAYNRSVFDSSIYSLCALGAAYGADQFMYNNGVTKVMHPLAVLKNGGLTDNDLGEIEAFQNLISKYGNPTDY